MGTDAPGTELPLDAATLTGVLHDAPAGVVVMDAAGTVRFWNAAATAIFGYPADEVLGRPLAELIIPDRFRDAHSSRLAAFVPGRGSTVLNQTIHLQGVRADGVELDLEVRVVPAGRPDALLFFGFIRDVTERLDWDGDLIEREHELRDMGERMRALLSSLPFGVLMEDKDRHLLLVNDAMFTIFEITRDDAREIAGRPVNVASRFADIFTDPDAFIARREEILAAKEPVIDERYVTVDGGVYSRDYIPIRVDGEYTGNIWLWRDVSGAAAAEAAQVQALENERTLRLAKEEQVAMLEDLQRLRGEFLAGVSHELRTPLTSLMGFAEMLGEEDLSAVQRDYVEVIERSGRRLLRLVTDLMLLARLEARTVALEVAEVDLVALARAAAADAQPDVMAAGTALVVQAEPDATVLVEGDAARLRQVVDNLLSNSSRFTPVGGRIEVRVHRDGDVAVLEVADTGVGIPESEQHRVFSHFWKGSNTADGSPGAGLGLMIGRAIVELHGGQISLTSREGVGTNVTLRLPMVDTGGAATGE